MGSQGKGLGLRKDVPNREKLLRFFDTKDVLLKTSCQCDSLRNFTGHEEKYLSLNTAL